MIPVSAVDDPDFGRDAEPEMPQPIGATPPSATAPLIWFDDPDGAYLAAAALRRYLDTEESGSVDLIPTGRGPTLMLPGVSLRRPLVRALLKRFGGHIEQA